MTPLLRMNHSEPQDNDEEAAEANCQHEYLHLGTHVFAMSKPDYPQWRLMHFDVYECLQCGRREARPSEKGYGSQ
jgi:hypothetical protein